MDDPQFSDFIFGQLSGDAPLGGRGFITSWPIRARDIYGHRVGGVIGVHEHQERIEVAIRLEERVARLVTDLGGIDAAEELHRHLGEAIAQRKRLRGEL